MKDTDRRFSIQFYFPSSFLMDFYCVLFFFFTTRNVSHVTQFMDANFV